MKPLTWSEVDRSPKISAVRHCLHFPVSEGIDWKDLNLEHSQQETEIKLLRDYFSKGSMRSAHVMYDCKMEKYFVAKFYIRKPASASTLKIDVEMQIVAKQLAKLFSLSDKVQASVDFVLTCWYEIKNPIEAGLSSSMTLFTAEPYIKGVFKKYNNNNGWINPGRLELNDTAQAFSHFTWEKTLGQLMVVDLQGVGSIFTDPQIHSLADDQFGCGNLSNAGMKAFFASHECNSVCKELGFRPLRRSSASKTDTKAASPSTEDRVMTCSCPLCGAITTVQHCEFTAAHQQGREIYCEPCLAEMNAQQERQCNVCDETFHVAPYWHLMKGKEMPTACKDCKAKVNWMENTARK
ncbi:hypothetical protein PHYBOEH_001128 [Phytophthora boehmeriae]|uniref:Alpha-type protein kinase domain-containing protein n=1 Tax=Phytophthora boehmeriae TaxID=109152 RepID=A0A8T1WZQ3_9STRA|nr:hypothetical protein PHYBOEH_001128 [Phytophthora boehmeriae]